MPKSEAAALDLAAINLLLEILELPEPVLSGLAAKELAAQAAAPLLAAGLLKPDGHEAASIDEDGSPVSLSWSDAGGYGYFSASRGWVIVEADSLVRWRVDPDALLTMLACEMRGVGLPSAPVIPGFLWDLGLFRLDRRAQPTSIWFGRRLFDAAVIQQVQDAGGRRPSANLRLLLTSTSGRRLQLRSLPGHLLVPLDEALSGCAGGALDPAALHLRMTGRDPAAVGEPLHLSPDGRTLAIHGERIMTFKSPIHISIVGQLVAAYRDGTRRGAREVLDEAGTDVGAFSRAFGPKRWPILRRYLKSRDGTWGFEL